MDIFESEKLSGKEKDKVKELTLVLSEFLRETEAGMPIYNKDGKSVPYPDEVVN